MSVITWCKPFGAIDMKMSRSIVGHVTSGAIPNAGRLIRAVVQRSDLNERQESKIRKVENESIIYDRYSVSGLDFCVAPLN